MTDDWDKELDDAITEHLKPSVKDLNRAVHARLDGLEALDAELTDLLRQSVWRAEAHVVMIHEQECTACGLIHCWSDGWYTHEQHTRDATATRKKRGLSENGALPKVVERVKSPTVDICGSCAELQLLTNEKIDELIKRHHLEGE